MKKEVKETVSSAITVALSTLILELLKKGIDILRGGKK